MIFNSEIHRPSSAKLWHIPHPPTVFPSVPGLLERTVPLEEQETSYLADSTSIFSLAKTFSFIITDLDSFRKYTINIKNTKNPDFHKPGFFYILKRHLFILGK